MFYDHNICSTAYYLFIYKHFVEEMQKCFGVLNPIAIFILRSNNFFSFPWPKTF